MSAGVPSPRPWFRARSAPSLGSAVRRARQVAALSQDELARKASTSRPTISRLERGSPVASSTLLDIAAASGYELVLVPRGARITIDTRASGGEP